MVNVREDLVKKIQDFIGKPPKTVSFSMIQREFPDEAPKTLRAVIDRLAANGLIEWESGYLRGKGPKVKKKYVLAVEGIAPIKLQLETWAYDENEALEQLNNPRQMNLRDKPEVDLPRMRRQKVIVREAYTSLVKLVKTF